MCRHGRKLELQERCRGCGSASGWDSDFLRHRVWHCGSPARRAGRIVLPQAGSIAHWHNDPAAVPCETRVDSDHGPGQQLAKVVECQCPCSPPGPTSKYIPREDRRMGLDGAVPGRLSPQRNTTSTDPRCRRHNQRDRRYAKLEVAGGIREWPDSLSSPSLPWLASSRGRVPRARAAASAIRSLCRSMPVTGVACRLSSGSESRVAILLQAVRTRCSRQAWRL